MADDNDGKVPLRTYIERLFDERTKTILSQIDLLNEKVLRERSHLDEIMGLHIEMHRNEHEVTSTVMARYEEDMGRRVSEMARTVEKLSDESHKFVRRDTVDERFQYVQEQVRRVEQNLAELTQLVSTTASKRDASVFYLALGFTAVNVMLNVFGFFK